MNIFADRYDAPPFTSPPQKIWAANWGSRGVSLYSKKEHILNSWLVPNDLLWGHPKTEVTDDHIYIEGVLDAWLTEVDEDV